MQKSTAVVVCLIGVGLVIGTALAWAQTTEQELKLLAPDGEAWDRFGTSVAVDGYTAVIGAAYDDDNGQGSGSAYVFTRVAGLWTGPAKLLASDGASVDGLGTSVAVDGDTVVIGAPADSDNDHRSGSAYVFTRAGGVWTEQAKLLPAGGAAWDQFGWSVAVDGDTAVIGAIGDVYNCTSHGLVYVFTRTAGVWTQRAKLAPADVAPCDWFGDRVAVDGDTTLIGRFGDDENGPMSGSVFVYTRTGGVWTEQARLLASDSAVGDWFGCSVAVDGNTAVIGASQDEEEGHRSGSAYVFTRANSVWTEQARLLPTDGEAWDSFGASVALDGETAVIGAHADSDNGSNSGSAYVFARSEGVWSERAKLLASDGEADAEFGKSVALDGDSAVMGATGDDDNGPWSGSAYVNQVGCRITVTTDGPDTLIFFAPGSSRFDLVTGDLADLLTEGGFSQSVCLGSYSAGDPAVDTSPDPPAGDGRYYLARGYTGCVPMQYGDSSLTPDPRDALHGGPCP
jgi:hypothetical protein